MIIDHSHFLNMWRLQPIPLFIVSLLGKKSQSTVMVIDKEFFTSAVILFTTSKTMGPRIKFPIMT